MTVETIEYQVGSTHFRGALVADGPSAGRPLLLVAPNWLGPTEGAVARARTLVAPGYVGFVVDMYGEGRTAAGPPEAMPLAGALRGDPAERRRRILGSLDAFLEACRARGIGDAGNVAAVGFCFGGGNVLELARAGAALKAAICFHGDLTSPLPAAPGIVTAPLLVLHGAADPIAPKSERDGFEAEMNAAGARWQMQTFGGAVHSFAEEEADEPGVAAYDAVAARYAYATTERFLADAFSGAL